MRSDGHAENAPDLTSTSGSGAIGTASTSVYVFRVQDYRNREVVLTQTTWQYHILFDLPNDEPGHPEMVGHEGTVQRIVQNPAIATRDPNHRTREQLYGLVASAELDRIIPMRVVVDYEGTPGRVVTAHFLVRIKLSNTGGVIYECHDPSPR